MTKLKSKPIYRSFSDFRARVTDAELREKFRAAAKKSNRERLLSDAPEERLSGLDVWAICLLAKGRCTHCGSLAVERRPSGANGVPLPWQHMGRRIGSLDHLTRRVDGGGNELSNLAWSCLWCNTRPDERQRGASDHGGVYPDEPPGPLRMLTPAIPGLPRFEIDWIDCPQCGGRGALANLARCPRCEGAGFDLEAERPPSPAELILAASRRKSEPAHVAGNRLATSVLIVPAGKRGLPEEE